MVLQGALALIEHRHNKPSLREEAYSAFLQALAGWGVFDRPLPIDSSRELRVSLPFCGSCGEAPLLLPFLAEKYLGTGLAGSMEVFACDVDAEVLQNCGLRWEVWTAYSLGPRVRLKVQQCDLSQAPLPEAHFILGVHPCVSGVGADTLWRKIMANILLASVAGGRCIFATFYAGEAQKVQRICRELGYHSEVRENPFYAGAPPDKQGTHLRFAVLVAL